jgi:hypothetical protein
LDAPSPPGGGFGLMLLEELTDDLQIASNEPGPGTSVHASFDRVRRRAAIRVAPVAATKRAAILREYVYTLQAAHEALQDETEAVFAQTSQALAHARRLQRARARLSRRG